MFTFDQSKVLKDHVIGSGAFSTVYPYGKSLQESQWVVKQLKAATFDKVLQIVEEVVLGFNLNHDSVVPIRGYYIKQDNPGSWEIYIKQPRMKKDLRRMIKNHELAQVDFTEEVIVKCFYALASALEHLHSKRIAHRDIKPENILIDFDGNIKLGDIGGAKFVAEGESFITVRDDVGTPAYSAPEVVKIVKHMKMKDLYLADIWSLGVVIVELCTGKRVYGIDKPEDIKRKVNKVAEKYSSALMELLFDILQTDPTKRKSASEIKKNLDDNFAEIIMSGSLKASEIEDIEVKIKEESVLEISQDFSLGSIVIEEAKMGKIENNGIIAAKDSFQKLKFNFSKTKLSLDHCLASVNEQIKSNLRFLNDFTLNCSNYSEITSLALKQFAVHIAPLNLQRLIVDFSECEKIKDDGIADFASIFSRPNLQNLEHLNISFARCTKVKDDGIKKLGEQIGLNLKRLNYLKINLHHCHRITNKGVKHLAFYIGRGLSHLQHLDIDLGKMTEVNEQGIRDLRSNLEPLFKSLQHFSLELWGLGSSKNTSHLELISALGARAQSMQFLSLSFGRCHDITDEVVIRIKNEIASKLEGLKYLSINLDCSKITGDMAIELADAIKENLKNLTYLALSFDCTKVDKQTKSVIEKKLEGIQEVIVTVASR